MCSKLMITSVSLKYVCRKLIESLQHISVKCRKLWIEICEIRQIFKGDSIKFCESITKITNSQKPLFKCKKLVINTIKCDLCLFLHKMCCMMVWKLCEIWKILWELASRLVKLCEILSQCEIWPVCQTHIYIFSLSMVKLDVVMRCVLKHTSLKTGVQLRNWSS